MSRGSVATNVLTRDTVILGKWRIGERIGTGTFSEIYSARNIKTGEDAAVKVEKRKESTLCSLDKEAEFLRRLPSSPHMPQLLQYGVEAGNRYLVMNRLGPNVSDLRRRLDQHKFSYSTAVQVAMKMLCCLRTVHESGLIHRDVKPSNCLVGLVPHHTTLVMVDFGLAKVFVDGEGRVLPAAERADFRGTSLYASLAAHENKDLGRKDDLWSLFFMLVDQTRPGALPWRSDSKLPRAEVFRLKRRYMGDLQSLVGEIPHSHHVLAIARHLSSLAYEQEPNYDLLLGLMRCMLRDNNDSESDLPDWVTKRVYPRDTRAVARAVPEAGGATTAPTPAAAAPAERLITVPVPEVQWREEAAAFAVQWVELVKPFLNTAEHEVPDVDALELLYAQALRRPDLFAPALLQNAEVLRASLALQVTMHEVERKLTGPVLSLKRRARKLKIRTGEAVSSAGLRRPYPGPDAADDLGTGKRRMP